MILHFCGWPTFARSLEDGSPPDFVISWMKDFITQPNLWPGVLLMVTRYETFSFPHSGHAIDNNRVKFTISSRRSVIMERFSSGERWRIFVTRRNTRHYCESNDVMLELMILQYGSSLANSATVTEGRTFEKRRRVEK
jgi:hypothetical protein